MSHKATFSLLLSLILLLLPLYASAAVRVGGWSPISDVKDAHVVEIGQFAVSEYNRRSQSGFKFVTVVSGETQVVAGTNYRLVVAVDGNGSKKYEAVNEGEASVTEKYEAIVWEKPWLKFMNLTSFKPATNGRFL